MAAATVTVTTYALCLMATQCAQDAMSGLCEKGNDYMSVPLEYSSYSSNKCLNVAGGNHAAGTLLEVWDCNGGTSQNWNFNNGTGAIYDAADPTLCLDAGTARNQERVTLQKCDGSPKQTWTRNAREQFTNGADPTKCLDNNANIMANGNMVIVWDCNNSAYNVWKAPQGA